jgi:hypothetical protein
MAINSLPKRGDRTSSASAVCDICDHSEVVRADYEKTHAGFKVNEGQVVFRLTQNNWSYIKGVLRCPECEAKRRGDQPIKNKEEPIMTQANDNVVAITPAATEELRQPSREQKRQIISLLTEVYDTSAGRYTGGETDKTVAEAIGNGVMFGWVAQIRDELFGPEGGNEELETLDADFKEWTEEAADVAKSCHDDIQKALASLREYNKLRDKIGALSTRIEALKTAIGPRARNV